MPVIFISYRRSDSQDVTGRIYDRLTGRFTQQQVFKDVDSIPLGVSFPIHLHNVLSTTSVVLVIIGPTWVMATDEHGRRRLDDPDDFVRLEIEHALSAGVPVIPVLISNARMPAASELPESIRPLVSQQGTVIRADPDFNHDIARLVAGLERLEKEAKASRSSKSAAAATESQPRPRIAGRRLLACVLVAVAVTLVLGCPAAWFYRDSFRVSFGLAPVEKAGDNKKGEGPKNEEREELAKFNGTWIVEASQKDGRPIDVDEVFTFTDGIISAPGLRDAKYTIDARKEPKWFDIVSEDSYHKGIYKFEGPNLVLATGILTDRKDNGIPVSRHRPDSFVPAVGTSVVMLVREKPGLLKITASLESGTIAVAQGKTDEFKAKVTWGNDIGDVILGVEVHDEKVKKTRMVKAKLEPGELKKPGDVTVAVTVAADAVPGTYSLLVGASSDRGPAAHAQFYVKVDKK